MSLIGISSPTTLGPGNATDIQRDAMTRINAVFSQYGLDGLSDWAWKEIQNGTSVEGMMVDLYQQPVFKQRFWVIDARQKAGLSPVSPQDIINYEQSWSQMARAAGLPPGMADKANAQKLLAVDVSPAEAQDRVMKGYLQMRQSSPEVKAAFQSYFGIQGDAALASLFVDPEMAMPDLERMVNQAEIGGTAAMHGYDVSKGLADRLAEIGIDRNQAQRGFTNLDQERHLFEQTISETEPLTAETGISAEFGLDGKASEQVRKVAQQREADFRGSAGQAADQSGIIGAGQARST